MKARVGEAVEISVRPITAATLPHFASVAVPLRWREPPVGPQLRPDGGRLHERLASTVPLPPSG